MDAEKMDKWLAGQEQELLLALVSVAGRSADPEVRGVHGRIIAARQMRLEIAEQRKKGGAEDG